MTKKLVFIEYHRIPITYVQIVQMKMMSQHIVEFHSLFDSILESIKGEVGLHLSRMEKKL